MLANVAANSVANLTIIFGQRFAATPANEFHYAFFGPPVVLSY